jgi:hypothetical protein
MAEIDWKAVHRLEEAAASVTRAADRIEESARRIGQQFEPGYGGNGERLIEALESVPQADEAVALRDMLESARADMEVIREALGVPVEPHQSLVERMVEAAKAKRGAVPQGWKPMPLNGSYELSRAFRKAETAALLSGHDHIEAFQCGYRAMLAAAPAADHFGDANKMVPEDPTESMLDAAEKVDWSDSDTRASCVKLWHVMLAAAPQPEADRRPAISYDAVNNALDAALRWEKKQAKCDGNLGGPSRADSKCWNDSAPIENGDDMLGGAR